MLSLIKLIFMFFAGHIWFAPDKNNWTRTSFFNVVLIVLMFRFVYQHFSFHLIPLLLLEFFDWVCLSELFWNPLLKREYLVINSLVMLRTRLWAYANLWKVFGNKLKTTWKMIYNKGCVLWFCWFCLSTLSKIFCDSHFVICLNGDDEWFCGVGEQLRPMKIWIPRGQCEDD